MAKRSYKEHKEALRDEAIEWQEGFSDMVYYWSDIAAFSDYFTKYGKRYGLLREFRENGII